MPTTAPQPPSHPKCSILPPLQLTSDSSTAPNWVDTAVADDEERVVVAARLSKSPVCRSLSPPPVGAASPATVSYAARTEEENQEPQLFSAIVTTLQGGDGEPQHDPHGADGRKIPTKIRGGRLSGTPRGGRGANSAEASSTCLHLSLRLRRKNQPPSACRHAVFARRPDSGVNASGQRGAQTPFLLKVILELTYKLKHGTPRGRGTCFSNLGRHFP